MGGAVGLARRRMAQAFDRPNIGKTWELGPGGPSSAPFMEGLDTISPTARAASTISSPLRIPDSPPTPRRTAPELES
jgi:hypothetical protein